MGEPDVGVMPGRTVKAALLACGMFTTLGLFSPGLVLPQIEREFASMPSAGLLTQLVGGAASFAFAIGAPVAGALVSRVGCRAVIMPALVLFALFGTAPTVLNDLWAIIATRVLLGLSLAGIFTGALSGIGCLPAESRARMFGLFAVVGGVTAIVMFPAIGVLARIEWRLAFMVYLVALMMLPLAWRLPPALGRASRVEELAERLDAGAAPLLSPAMLGLLGLAALSGMAMFISPMLAPLYFASLGITDTRQLAIPVTLGAVAAVCASAAYGPIQRCLGVKGVSAAMLGVMGVALVVAASVESAVPFTIAIVVHSATLAVIAPNVSASALAFSSPGKGAQAIGLANGVMFGAQLLFPFVASAVRHAAGLAGVFYFFGASALAVALVLSLRIVASRRAAVPSGT